MHLSSFALAAFTVFAAPGFQAEAVAASAGPSSTHHVSTKAYGVAPDILARRDALMKQGKKDLAAGNADAAANAFETAVSMVHAPDAELALVRSHMQAGHYRQALASSAHTAGAHKEEVEGVALYVWLLYLGGQEAAAKRILLDTQARAPGNAMLAQVQRWIESGSSPSSALRGAMPAFTPYSVPALAVTATAMSGSGVLIDGGHYALAPLFSVARASRIWLRNGLGQLRKATVEQQFKSDGLVLLRLEQPLPIADGFMAAGRDPFPGSLVYSTEYSMVRNSRPEWPVLRHGFLGSPLGDGRERGLGIPLSKGPRGGPVFDASGALAGIAMSGPDGEDRLLPIGRIRQALGDRIGSIAPPMKGPRLVIEQVYENAMRTTLQVLIAR
jgi:hypothetical protein